jgi:hypothetical protein
MYLGGPGRFWMQVVCPATLHTLVDIAREWEIRYPTLQTQEGN